MAGKKTILLFILVVALAFLGLPVPDWLASFVSAVAGFISSIFSAIIKLLQFIFTFGKMM